jgi:trans-2,3-dihydro-3-hydroxyanthranilate isomerase
VVARSEAIVFWSLATMIGMSTPVRSRQLQYVTFDVFSSRPLEGNQLAVFLDARGLSTDDMQAIARETNLSETTFILPGEERTPDSHRVRIFTVQEELPFAGHPTLGTAMALHQATGEQKVTLDLNVGAIPVEFSTRDDMAFGEMRQRDPEFGTTHAREAAARAAGLSLDDLASDVPIQTVSTGVPFIIVPVQKLATMQRLTLNFTHASEYLDRSDGKFFYFVSRETMNAKATLHARMIFYNGEDPATGSAAGCCTAWAVRHGVLAPETQGLIEQGVEMKRPSAIYIRASRTGDQVSNVRVGGHAVEVARGTVSL